jgi:hypothetical protein
LGVDTARQCHYERRSQDFLRSAVHFTILQK